MHIAIVGGLDRSESLHEELARRAGHLLECHDGDLAGRGARALSSIVERCDLVIVVTDLNSHNAVWRARRLAKERNKRCLLMSRCGTAKLSALLEQFSREEAQQRELPRQ